MNVDSILSLRGSNIADAPFHVVGDLFNEVTCVPCLNVEHLFINLIRKHPSMEVRRHHQMNTPLEMARDHHILVVEELNVSSGTVRARYCCDPRDVSGAKPQMKK
jgi:hypothetical protein